MSESVEPINVAEAFALAAKKYKYKNLLMSVFKRIREEAENGEFVLTVRFSSEELATVRTSPARRQAVYIQLAIILRSLGFTTAVNSINCLDYDLVVRWDEIPKDFPHPTFEELYATATLLKG
jgi:hypothetical protein